MSENAQRLPVRVQVELLGDFILERHQQPGIVGIENACQTIRMTAIHAAHAVACRTVQKINKTVDCPGCNFFPVMAEIDPGNFAWWGDFTDQFTGEQINDVIVIIDTGCNQAIVGRADQDLRNSRQDHRWKLWRSIGQWLNPRSEFSRRVKRVTRAGHRV